MQPEYRSQEDLAGPYEPTKADHRRQAEAEKMREHVERIVADAPPLTAAQTDKIRRIFAVRTPDHDLMRWRLRLYCGHIVETTQHCDQQRPSAPRACAECGRDPATVVAYEPLGRVAEPPGMDRQPTPQVAPRSARRSAERQRIAELEQEVARLRARLGDDDAETGPPTTR
jgi:hypothetical protein